MNSVFANILWIHRMKILNSNSKNKVQLKFNTFYKCLFKFPLFVVKTCMDILYKIAI